MADARAHFQTACAGDLVDVEHVVAVAHAEVDRIERLFGERLEMLPRHRGKRHLFERDGAEFDQLRAEQIAALHLAQIARLDETADEPVGGAAGRAERGAEGTQIAHAGGGGFENREAAQ